MVTMRLRKVSEDASIVDIAGEMTSFAEAKLMDAYNRATEGGAQVLILNFADLEYMNSSGIGLLVTLLIRANRQKQRLIAVGLNAHYQQIFELTRLNEAIAVLEDEAAALAVA
jgi:anti-anti-sigma factor